MVLSIILRRAQSKQLLRGSCVTLVAALNAVVVGYAVVGVGCCCCCCCCCWLLLLWLLFHPLLSYPPQKKAKQGPIPVHNIIAVGLAGAGPTPSHCQFSNGTHKILIHVFAEKQICKTIRASCGVRAWPSKCARCIVLEQLGVVLQPLA